MGNDSSSSGSGTKVRSTHRARRAFAAGAAIGALAGVGGAVAVPAAVSGVESLVRSSNTADAINQKITTPIAGVAITDANNAGVAPPSIAVSVTTSPNDGGRGEPSDASSAVSLAVQVAKAAEASEKKEGAPVGPITAYAAAQSPNENPSAFLNGAQAAIRESNKEAGR